MKGNNMLHLNGATMIEAVQEYLDKRYKPSVKVTSVGVANQAFERGTFEVRVEERPDPMPEWLGDGFNWGYPIGKLCAEAATQIETAFDAGREWERCVSRSDEACTYSREATKTTFARLHELEAEAHA